VPTPTQYKRDLFEFHSGVALDTDIGLIDEDSDEEYDVYFDDIDEEVEDLTDLFNGE